MEFCGCAASAETAGVFLALSRDHRTRIATSARPPRIAMPIGQEKMPLRPGGVAESLLSSFSREIEAACVPEPSTHGSTFATIRYPNRGAVAM